ncbi:cytochrome c [Methylobacillus flagellatus]|uniref:c-type cytochrome n=1 Tax=Methylobacillus flagellatus TaxID=405 RepID=UPI002853D3D4|nr:cytochrome c [Methylobacillus flagellatus]MDR5171397.1 cytochrome c [Methylobacillus flagellatus]
MIDENRRHDHPIQSEKNEVSTLALHDDAMHETAEPFEDTIKGPVWFYLFVVLSMVVGAFYLGRHMGRLDTAAHIGFLHEGGKPGQAQESAPAATVSGASIFGSRCATCHQANGQGVPGAFPPLVGAKYVLESPEVLVNIILHGLQGEIEVAGQTYNGIMPPWASQLGDEEVAAVASYIRSELGDNKADKVDAALVKKVREQTKDRQTPWTADELEAL